MRLVFARIGSMILLALPLLGCVGPVNVKSAGNWKIEQKPDTVTKTPISSAVVTTMAYNESEPFPQLSWMQLSCFIGHPVVSFHFPFRIGTNLNSFIGYRFDERPGHEIPGRFVASANTAVIDDAKDVTTFIEEMRSSKVLYLRIRSFNAWMTNAEFKVDGAAEAIPAAYATCPLKGEPPQRVATQGPARRTP